MQITLNAQYLKPLLVLLTIALCGCASSPYRVGQPFEADSPTQQALTPDPQIIKGRPHDLLDASDWIWPGSWLGKLLLWDKDIDSHEISACTVAQLERYLQVNQLDQVQVLVNSYSPGNQWRRLFKNKSVGAGWRYTLGILSVSFYTIMPGRFFGGDAYNPYTNTIYLYSDDASVAIHEGGHAKDFASREYKGLHAALYNLPFAALYYEGKATNDALSYHQAYASSDQLREDYRTLYPAYSTYIGGSLTNDLAFGPDRLIALGAVIPGHIAGWIASANVDEKPTQSTAEDPCFYAQPQKNASGVPDSL